MDVCVWVTSYLICDVKVKDRVPSIELRERLRLDDIISVLQQSRLHMGMCCIKKKMVG